MVTEIFPIPPITSLLNLFHYTTKKINWARKKSHVSRETIVRKVMIVQIRIDYHGDESVGVKVIKGYIQMTSADALCI